MGEEGRRNGRDVTRPPSGEQYEIAASRYRSVIVEVGGGIRTLEHDGHPILEAYEIDTVCDGAHGQLLIPWPNRIADATYDFAGTDHHLAVTEPSTGCAIHGLTRWSTWACTEHTAHSVRLAHRLHPQPGWDGGLEVAVGYTLDSDGLTVRLEARNVGATSVPFAAGAHPYLLAGDSPIDAWRLTLPAATRLVTDDRGIPVSSLAVDGTDHDFRDGRKIDAVALDDTFGDLTRDETGRAWAHLESAEGRRVSLWADETHSWFQVFTGDHLADPSRRRSAVAIEPMTAPPNAFRTGQDLIVLDPGDDITLSWGIQAG